MFFYDRIGLYVREKTFKDIYLVSDMSSEFWVMFRTTMVIFEFKCDMWFCMDATKLFIPDNSAFIVVNSNFSESTSVLKK